VLLRLCVGRYLFFCIPGPPRAPANQQLVREPSGGRRRFAASYAISIALHLAFVVFFLGMPGIEVGDSESDEEPVIAHVVTITHEDEPALTITHAARRSGSAQTPVPRRRPPPAKPAAPPAEGRPLPAPTVAPYVPAAQRELARIRPKAAIAARSTPPPAKAAMRASSAAQTPQPPTAVPSFAPVQPVEAATTAPTIPPDNARIIAQAQTPVPTPEATLAPRLPAAEPSIVPTPAPTAVPTHEATPRPTPLPTRIPTPTATHEPKIAPTPEPTKVPRLAATAAPTARALAPHTPGPLRSAAPVRPAGPPGASRAENGGRAVQPRPVSSAAVAFAQPGNPPQRRNPAEILNERLRALTLRDLLPRSEVTYSQRHYTNDDLSLLGQRIEQEWFAKLAPPSDIVAEIFGIVRTPRTELQPESITYLYRRTFFGLCYGWYITAHPLGGGPPQAGFTIVPCGKYEPVKPGSLVFPGASPSPAPRPQATAGR